MKVGEIWYRGDSSGAEWTLKLLECLGNDEWECTFVRDGKSAQQRGQYSSTFIESGAHIHHWYTRISE